MKWLILFILTVIVAVLYVRYAPTTSLEKSNPSSAVETETNHNSPTEDSPIPLGEALKDGPPIRLNSAAPPPMEPPLQAPPFNPNQYQNNLPQDLNNPSLNSIPPPPQFSPENDPFFNSVPQIDNPSPFEPMQPPDFNNSFEDSNPGYIPPPPPIEEGDY
ncbi:MAG: hypothetical protein EXR74_04035 [Bdellovibrionales bacterium]|nr:hypothetical protein [Bdellovibrionales bacterium]